MKKFLPYLAIILAMLIWAGSGIAVKAALVVLSPLQVVIVRFTVAVLLMAFIGLISHRLQRVQRQDWWLFALAGVFQPFLYFILETYTYRSFASPTMAEPFLSASPLVAPFFAWWLLKEKITRNNIIGIIASTIGMLLLVLAGNTHMEIGTVRGIPLALITMLMAVGYSVILKRIPDCYNPLTVVFWVQLVAVVLFYGLWLVTGHDVPQIDWNSSATCHMLTGIGYLAVFSSVCAFILFCYSVRYIGVTQANAFNNIRPVFTAILMWLLLDEHLPVWKLLGIGLIVVGLFICQKK